MKKYLFIFLTILLAMFSANAQPTSNMTLDEKSRKEVIEELIKNLNKTYVYLETAKLMETDLRRHLKNKKIAENTQKELDTMKKEKNQK